MPPSSDVDTIVEAKRKAENPTLLSSVGIPKEKSRRLSSVDCDGNVLEEQNSSVAQNFGDEQYSEWNFFNVRKHSIERTEAEPERESASNVPDCDFDFVPPRTDVLLRRHTTLKLPPRTPNSVALLAKERLQQARATNRN